MAENKFPSEVIDLPSEGKLYPEGSPLREGKIEVMYMTAKDTFAEDFMDEILP